jgi:hypothetical protein
MNEINNDYYCSTAGYDDCTEKGNCIESGCKDCHRKYPTPEQYKKEYGEDWKGAVYVICRKDKCNLGRRFIGSCLWFPSQIIVPKECLEYSILICACTPFGRPPSDWKPEEENK